MNPGNRRNYIGVHRVHRDERKQMKFRVTGFYQTRKGALTSASNDCTAQVQSPKRG
uniref:Uncharacterized protein n=1 Tax=viral metagenome TaxID=1070528 RepID=A0A6H1ZD55_9ZZZZ